jgi:2-hydroxy-3-keto-5-methylthiopentenyl-1-phosphate phosphatase
MFKNRLIQINQSSTSKAPFVMSNCRVFFDFDNTITITDVLDNIVKEFSVTDEWKNLERLWIKGEIGAKECLGGQLRGLRVTKKQLNQYLTKVKLDRSTYKLLSFLSKEGIQPVILSDNFTPIVEEILNNHSIKDVKIYANSLRYYKDRLIPTFPYDNPFHPFCAHCKRTHLTRDQHIDKLIVYIGDGRSDFCAAEASDVVFAKDVLLAHMKKENREHIPYKNLEEVYNYFKEAAYGADFTGA